MKTFHKPVIVVDFETMFIKGYHIPTPYEIGAVILDEHLKPAKAFSSLTNCGKLLTTDETNLTGITNEQVEKAPKPSDVMYQLMSTVIDCGLPWGNMMFASWPVNFDYPVMSKFAHLAGVPNPFKHHDTFCIRSLWKSYCFLNGFNSTLSLQGVHKWLMGDNKTLVAHRALDDVQMKTEIMCRLLLK